VVIKKHFIRVTGIRKVDAESTRRYLPSFARQPGTSGLYGLITSNSTVIPADILFG